MHLPRWLFRRAGYDIFLSYKSQDAHLARHVAERLFSAGRRVWFAEYEILLRRYARFEAAIEEGIGGSRYGLALTGDRYAASEHCRRELAGLLARCGPERIFDARVTPGTETRRLFPALAGSPACDGCGVEEIVGFVCERAGWPTPPPALAAAAAPPRHAEADCMGGHYRLDVTGWEVLSSGEQSAHQRSFIRWDLPRHQVEVFIARGVLPQSFEGPSLRRDDAGRGLFMNLHAGPEPSPNARRSEPNPDDRAMYRELMEYLPGHLRRLGRARLRGLHLVFQGGFSQLAVTYRWAGYWTRKYSVILPHPTASFDTEFVFTFGFRGAFADFCRRAHLMDRVVTSLRWV